MPSKHHPIPRKLYRFLTTVSLCTIVSGCGLGVPQIKEAWDEDIPADPQHHRVFPISANTRIEFEIRKRIYCDLRWAVLKANTIPVQSGPMDKLTTDRSGLFPKNWGAEISLSLQVDETGALNPGVTFNGLMPNYVTDAAAPHPVVTAQSSSVGLGGTLSSTATRVDKFDPHYSIQYLSRRIEDKSVCERNPAGNYINDPFDVIVKKSISSPFIIDSNDLGIEDWLVGSMMNYALLEDMPKQGKGPKKGDSKAPGPDTLTLEEKFVIITSGSVTPSWKLARISANTGMLPFIQAGRTRTHDLIITIGPQNDPQTHDTFFASQVGQAVSGGNRSALTPLQ